ncbi:MAG: PBP1A family penicillin-binding protein [Ignavibacteria bacterium]|nr:PBP1A family penicillin-binding protein [Ignavibacteria bacterium]
MAPEKGTGYSSEEMERYFNDPEYRKKKRKSSSRRQMTKRVRRNLIIISVFLLLIATYMVYLFSGLPSLEKIENPKPELATRVYSYDGEILDQFFIKNRSHFSIQEIPKIVIDALIATEDKNFRSHWGVDAPRVIKAMVKNVIFFRREGASTITQQLSRNLYLGHSDRNIFDTFTRKIREFITAVQLERNFTKDEILEFYLNVVLFGRGSYGISSGSQMYFGKSPADLTLSEAATLIALLKGPGYYDPINHPERAISRRNLVLSQMLKYGYISEEVAIEVKTRELGIKSSDDVSRAGIASHFVEYVRQQLTQKAETYGFDIYRDGLRVYTTLDSRMQRYANKAVEEHLAEYQAMFDKLWNWREEQDALARVIDLSIRTSADYRKASSARQRDSVYKALGSNESWIDSMKQVAKRIEVGFVAIDPKNGNIRALVGGSNFKDFKYGLNHVTQIRRQVGSAFKPFVYTVAIDNGYPPCFELLNQPVTIMMADGKRWSPTNADGRFGGKSTLRDGLQRSINLIAVRAIMEIAPVKQVIEYAKRMGISSPLPPYESLALGSGDVSPLDATAAFAVFANHGVYVEPTSILKIENKEGNLIEENTPLQREVLSEETSFIMTSMLKGAVDEGTGIGIRRYFHLPAAGKTGTTNDFADAWFIGYTPQLVAGVWVGFDNKTVHFKNWDGQGGRAAAPIWARFMKYVYDDPDIAMPLEYFEKPPTVFEETICTDTKKLATEYCPTKTTEYFTEKTLPGKCNRHTSLRWNEGEEGLGSISF